MTAEETTQKIKHKKIIWKKHEPKIIIALIIGTILFGAILILMDLNPMLVLIGGGITWAMFYVLGVPLPKYKDFSDHDRLETTLRVMSGSGAQPELPIPELHEKNTIIKTNNNKECRTPCDAGIAVFLSQSWRLYACAPDHGRYVLKK